MRGRAYGQEVNTKEACMYEETGYISVLLIKFDNVLIINIGSSVAQHVKNWPADLAVL